MPEEAGGKSQKPKAPGKKKEENLVPPKEPEIKKSMTLEDQVDALQKELEKKKKDISREEKDLMVLKRATGEINRVSDSYGKALENLKRDKEDIQAYYESKTSMIRAQVDEKKETEIKEKTAAVDKEIEREEEKVKELENKFIEAKNGCDRAEKGFKKVKEDYDSARELQKEIDHKLSELNHTRKSIEEEEKKKNFANVYFLIDGEERESGLGSLMKELAELTEKSKRLSPALGEKFEMKAALEEFKTTLAKRWKAFYEAERDLSVKEKEMEQAKDAFAEGQERWDQLRKSRRSNILEKLKEIKFSK